MSDLPPGWEWTTFGDVAETCLGKMLDRSKFTGSNAVPYLRNINVQWGRFDLDNILTIEIPPEQQSFFVVRPGDLMVCEGGEIGRCAVWPGSKAYMAFQKALHRLRPYPGVDARFLRYLLEHYSYTNAFAPYSTGSTIKHLPQQQLRRLPLPLPPLNEQRRIIAALDDHLSNLDSATRLLNRAVVGLTRFRSSLLREVVRGRALPATCVRHAEIDSAISSGALREPTEGPWQVPEDWSWSTIGELFQVFVGATPKRSIAANWTGEVPWVSSGEVAFNRISATREGISFAALGNRETRLHPPGTVLLAMIGEGRTRGQAAVLNIAAAHNQNCASIRVSETDVLPEYVYAVLEDRYEQTRRTASGGNQLALNGSIVRAIQIAIPPAGTQKVIVDHLDELRGAEDRLRRALAAELRRGEILRKTILADAISGQLAPQKPSDEPASVLLERIRAERATQSKTRRARRTKNPDNEQESML